MLSCMAVMVDARDAGCGWSWPDTSISSDEPVASGRNPPSLPECAEGIACASVASFRRARLYGLHSVSNYPSAKVKQGNLDQWVSQSCVQQEDMQIGNHGATPEGILQGGLQGRRIADQELARGVLAGLCAHLRQLRLRQPEHQRCRKGLPLRVVEIVGEAAALLQPPAGM